MITGPAIDNSGKVIIQIGQAAGLLFNLIKIRQMDYALCLLVYLQYEK
jgi:hypothetical protein